MFRPLTAPRFLSLLLAAPLGLAPFAASRSLAETAAPAPAVHVAFIEGRPFAEVLKKARAENKSVMLDVVASWCGPCKIMDRTTFADPGVVDWTKKRVVAARVDAEKGEGRKLASRYAVGSFPTVLFLDAAGGEMDRLLGVHQAPQFQTLGEEILGGKLGTQFELDALDKQWEPERARKVVLELARRNDVARLRPLAMRIIADDPDLAQTETVETFLMLAAVEDIREKLSPETTDLLKTFLPRLLSDPQRGGVLAVVLTRELGRRGDVAGALATATNALKALPDPKPFAADLLSAVGTAEKKAGKADAAAATYRRALGEAEANGAGPSLKALLEMELAESLTMAGQTAEAKKALAGALGRAGGNITALVRASRLSLRLKSPQDAVAQARKAVELSQGEDPEAQAALATALAATGDPAGAAAAWERAGAYAPENAEYRKRLDELKKKPASAKTS